MQSHLTKAKKKNKTLRNSRQLNCKVILDFVSIGNLKKKKKGIFFLAADEMAQINFIFAEQA